MDLTTYDLIVVNSSAGKDSQAMLDVVAELAAEQGVTDRVVVLHCDLGEVEWEGTLELARTQAEHYPLPFTVERHAKGLLARVLERGKWPGPTTRYCTSELKTGMAKRATTRLLLERGLDRKTTGRQAKVLHTLGLRAAESPARAKKVTFEEGIAGTSGARRMDRWLPIHGFSDAQVWDRIARSGVPYHPVYDQGMPRLSCSMCFLASPGALMLAALLRPAMADRYVEVERTIGHDFRSDFSIESIVVEARRRQAAGEPLPEITVWSETGGACMTGADQLELGLEDDDETLEVAA